MVIRVMLNTTWLSQPVKWVGGLNIPLEINHFVKVRIIFQQENSIKYLHVTVPLRHSRSRKKAFSMQSSHLLAFQA